MRKKRFLIFGIALVFTILLSLQCSAYIKSSVQGVSPGLLSGGLASSGGQWVPDRTMCEAGQDFAVQIPPFGCEPAVVRSDLLEEQNTPIFCQLSATKMNPLLSIDAIESISFSGKQLPPEISGVGFFPAQAALGVSSKLNTPSLSSPILNNIGYAVIVLKKQPNESAMPDVVSGNLTATLKYDIKNAYGIGEARFYLPEISDGALWERVMSQYGFWNGKGYLRADAVSSEDARISLYVNNNSLKTISLDKGETSNEIFLPGFDCFVGVKLKLEDLTAPNRRAILSINGNTIQLNEGEKFLDNKCTLVSSESRGLTKKATINCKEDQGSTGNFDLVLTPRVSLDIGEAKGREYSTGDYLYDGMQTVEDPFTKKKTDRKVYVYLGYIGTKEDSGKLDDLYITFVSTPVNSGQKLSDIDIASYASRSEKRFSDIYRDKALILAGMAGAGAKVSEFFKTLRDTISKDKEIKYLPYKQDAVFNEGYFGEEAVSNVWVGKEIKINGFASPVNSALKEGGASSKYYTSASQDYSKVVTSFAAEKDPITSGIVLGEDAYAKNIILANILDQRGDVERLCKEFKSAYASNWEKNDEVRKICSNPSKQSSATSSTREVTINTVQKIISLEDVREPRFEDFGVRIKVTMPDKSVQQLDLIKDRTTFVNPSQVDNSQTYIKLVSINKDTIEVDVNRPKVGTADIIRGVYESNRQTLKKGTKDSFGTVYSFEIVEIYDKKEAKVLVIPTVNRVQTKANFSFQIGIEKRAIQLSPEKTKEKIESLNKTISQWSDINEKLTKVVEGMKGACLATGLALTMKNFVNNVGGQSIARQEVMSGPGGWNQKCLDMVTSKTIDQDKNGKDIIYKTIDECIMTNAGKIDSDVNAFYDLIKKQDAEIKPLQEACKIPGEGILTEKVINTECLRRDYAKAIKEELSTNWKDYKFDLNGEKISATDVLELIDDKKVSIEDMRKIHLYAKAKQAGVSSGLYTQELNTLFADIYASNRQEIATANVAKELGIDASMIPYVSLTKEPAKVVAYNGLTYEKVADKINLCPSPKVSCSEYSDTYCWEDPCSFVGINKNTPVQYFSGDGGKAYLATLKQVGTKYHIQKIYNLDAATPTLIPDKDVETFASKVNFEIMNQESYTGNTYKSSLGSSAAGPMLRCYETEPYKGYPAIAPVDTKNGWYVSIPQNLPAFGNIASFDASGRVMSFYICNVWEGGVEENRGGNDKCSQINLGISQPQVGGLDSAASKKLIDEAVKVVEKAQTVCKTGKAGQTFSLGANANGIKMGAPAANLPEVSCYNFMSPSDCKILFNVCDPVVCPSSRCDFGGKYPVKDVIQSGIIGSTLLCLPNFVGTGGDVYIPVCLSGIKAGLDGLLSVFKSYRDCLQESLNTGKMTGICDEIHSIYLCDFFWKQTLPLAKMIVPKTIELIMGKSVRGGGEYMSVQDAWTTAGQSMDYFAQYYAADAYIAFKARITQEVTDAVCKTYISGAYPDGGKITDSLTQASSPPQYYGRFYEMTYTTATNPPISQYKVFYHIYAGENSRAYYQVYLTEAAGSSYYQDTSTKLVVDTGYIEQGGTSDQTKDFTAVSGYKKMCINVNGREDCGFEQVTSSFALDYVADQYVKEQINQTDITTESACNSGTSSAWSLVSPSVQGAAGELVSPQLYNRGVIRICANDNPGAAMDKDAINPRWVPVGYCGQRTLKCWLDTQSVKDAVNWNSSVTNILGNLTSDFLTQMKNEGKYFTDLEFKAEATRISKLLVEDKNFVSVINSVNAGLSKASMNSEKGKLYILRAQAYGALAEEYHTIDRKEAEKAVAVVPIPPATPVTSAKCSAYSEAINNFKAPVSPLTSEKDQVSIDFITDIFSKDLIAQDEYMGFVNEDKTLEGFISAETMQGVLTLLQDKYAELCAGQISAGLISHGRALTSFPVDSDILKKISKNYGAHIKLASTTFGIEENLIKSIIYVESEGNPNADNENSHAKGLMQLMKTGAIADITLNLETNKKGGCYNKCTNYYGAYWETDPKTNIMIGTCYLACIRDVYKVPIRNNDWTNWITSYNAGPSRFMAGGICYDRAPEDCSVLLKENKEYAGKVLKVYGTLTGVPQTGASSVATSVSSSQVITKKLFLATLKYLDPTNIELRVSSPLSCDHIDYSIYPSLGLSFFGLRKVTGTLTQSDPTDKGLFVAKIKKSTLLNSYTLQYVSADCMNKNNENILAGGEFGPYFISEDSTTVTPSAPTPIVKPRTCESLEGDYLSAIDTASKLDQTSKYTQNNKFVDGLLTRGLITEEEFDALAGKRYFGIDVEKDMANVLVILKSEYKNLCEVDPSKLINKINTLSFSKSSESLTIQITHTCKNVLLSFKEKKSWYLPDAIQMMKTEKEYSYSFINSLTASESTSTFNFVYTSTSNGFAKYCLIKDVQEKTCVSLLKGSSYYVYGSCKNEAGNQALEKSSDVLIV